MQSITVCVDSSGKRVDCLLLEFRRGDRPFRGNVPLLKTHRGGSISSRPVMVYGLFYRDMAAL